MRKLVFTKHTGTRITGYISTTSLAFALVGCGGATQEPTTPTSPDSSLSAGETDGLGIQSAEPPTPAAEAPIADEPDGASSPSEPVSAQEFQNALQAVIQDDAFLTALKLEEPGRFPLKIAGEGLPTGLELTASEKAVEVVAIPEDTKKTAVVVFLKIELSEQRGTFKYRYDVEGVRGTSRVAKDEGAWILKSSRISAY